MGIFAKMKWLAAVMIALTLCLPRAGGAQEMSALARFDPAGSAISAQGPGVAVRLALSQPVPWRVRVLDGPPRLVLDMREVDWTGVQTLEREAAPVVDLRAGVFRPGWSRLVLVLAGPMAVTSAEMVTTGETRLNLMLEPVDQAAFAAAAGLPEPREWALPATNVLAAPPVREDGKIIVVLDPGHGGIDPGAERDGQTEAALVLRFAKELKELLARDGRFQVVMTRDEDGFVPLEARVSVARAAAADVFISLHADALAEGEAVGATIYTLDAEASDEASAALAERHDRDDLLAGVDLTEQDDLVATVLMDMARTETKPRIDRLAAALMAAIKDRGVTMHRHPLQTAGFSVLKSPDIPSVLVELGFLSSARDLERLNDAGWRADMAEALRQGLVSWADADAAIQSLSPGGN